MDNPTLRPYRTLRRPDDHRRDGIFVAEGQKVVERLIDSKLDIISALMTEIWYDRLHHERPGLHGRIPEIYIADKSLVESIVGYNLHQGIMAVGKVPGEPDIRKLLGEAGDGFLSVALDGLMNAENVGVVMRNCAAFGVHAVITGDNSSSPYLRRSVRNSMGAVFGLPIVHSRNLRTTLESMHEKSVRIIATVPDGKIHVNESDLTGRVCIVLGGEEKGVSPGVLDICTERLAIPMAAGTDSLNVANASAVFLYEARRQREIRS